MLTARTYLCGCSHDVNLGLGLLTYVYSCCIDWLFEYARGVLKLTFERMTERFIWTLWGSFTDDTCVLSHNL